MSCRTRAIRCSIRRRSAPSKRIRAGIYATLSRFRRSERCIDFMPAYILRRLLLLVPTAAGMVVITFSLLLLIPGDPAAVLLGQEASKADIANLRATLGLDLPWSTQLLRYFAALLQGDMGRSLFQNEAVSAIIRPSGMAPSPAPPAPPQAEAA